MPRSCIVTKMVADSWKPITTIRVGTGSRQLIDFGIEVIGTGRIGDKRINRAALALEVFLEGIGQALSIGLLSEDHTGDLVAF